MRSGYLPQVLEGLALGEIRQNKIQQVSNRGEECLEVLGDKVPAVLVDR